MAIETETGPGRRRGLGREVAGGLFLVAFALVALAGSASLAFGRLSSIGPGLMPRSTAIILALFGLVMVATGLLRRDEPLDPWSLRGIVLVLGAVGFFAATVRPLGLAVAGPVAVVLAALADPATRMREVVPFALLLTAACVVLFKLLLRQPIPVAPWLLGW